MGTASKEQMDEAIAWCRSVLEQVEVLSDHTKEHSGHDSATCRLRTPTGLCYLKIHQSREHWSNEVHAYERWAGVFGKHAPRLMEARDHEPLALVVSELPGRPVDSMQLSASQERAVWRAAGAALVGLHDSDQRQSLGPRSEESSWGAEDYISGRLQGQIDHAVDAGYVSHDELLTIRAAQSLTPSFEGEHLVPCHGDYCPSNWLVAVDGSWVGVIDFEFSHRGLRVTDFSGYPSWEWMDRPDLDDAFFEGYGWSLTATHKQQLLVGRVAYALGMIIWGHENAYFGSEREGRECLAHLAPSLR